MTDRADFDFLVEKAMKIPGRTNMRPTIEKELLHYDILFSLDNAGLLDKLTFQGGTSLRLCYGASRFSEDLDFAGGVAFSSNDMQGIKQCLEHYIGERYGFEIVVKEPREMALLADSREIKVDKWQVAIVTSPARKDLPKQKIKIEVANIPAYSRSPKALKQNYDFLPDGYSDILIMTETLDEIMADKIVAFVGCQRYIRYRDIWDLRWLKQQGAKIIPEYILSKIKDYKELDYPKKLQIRSNTLAQTIQSKAFLDEMSRFIPMDVQERTLKKPHFLELLLNIGFPLIVYLKMPLLFHQLIERIFCKTPDLHPFYR